MARKHRSKRGAGIFTSDETGPSIFSRAASGVTGVITSAKNAVTGTAVAAQQTADQVLPGSPAFNSQAAGRRLRTAKGDKMLGGRRRSKKSRKHTRRR